MKLSPETIILSVSRSPFMKAAPMLLWLIAIVVPVLTGRNIYLETFKFDQEQALSMARHQLMTRARGFEARLEPEKIIFQQLQLQSSADAFYKVAASDSEAVMDLTVNSAFPDKTPLIKCLPALHGNADAELASFASFLRENKGIAPVFIAGLNPDPQKCGLFIDEEIGLTPLLNKGFRQEFSEIWQLLNRKSVSVGKVAAELRSFGKFSFFSEFLGIFDHFTTDFWTLQSSFSGRYRERLYIVSMRLPFSAPTEDSYILGILTSRQSPQKVLQTACAEMSAKDINFSSGRTVVASLPVFIEEAGNVTMISKLPELFRAIFRRPGEPDRAGDTVLRLSIPTDAGGKGLKLHATHVNLAIMAFLCLTLLFAAGTSLGQVRIRTNLVRLITAAFFVSMLLPLSGLAWLGAASARNNREDESQQIVKLVRQNLRQTETAFMLQRFRQQLLLLHLSRVIATIGAARWDEFVKHFFLIDAESSFRSHFFNFYLYSAQFDREFFRGQHSEDRFRKNELPTVMSGAFRRFLMNAGSYDHLSEGGRQKIAQLADFSSGVVEELVDNNFFNRLFSSPGELHSATQLARPDLLTVFFVRGPQKIYGMLCFATNNYLPALVIDELNARGSFKNRFTLQNHRIDIDFFNINGVFERRLDDRDSPFAIVNPPATSIEAADTLYADSDSTSIDNLHLDPPHLLVTETMLDRSIFAVARIQPPDRPAGENSGSAMLALIALTSCLALAAGISRLILLPVTPFLAALKEVENNHYDWNLNLQTGDEFDQLASSINNMRVSLLERRKMLQLVSQSAAEAVKSGEDTENKPRRRPATILFSDIRGFTTISEGHAAEDVVKMLNSYFTLMCPAVEEHGGYIDKLIGDAIQAVFIAEDPFERVMGAAMAALEIRRRLAAFNVERAARGLFAVNNGIGIASGMITTGLTGSKTGKLEAAVMGEPLQMASILESKSKFATNTCIILDEESQKAIKDHARFKTLVIDASNNAPAFSITELQEILQSLP